MEVDTATSAGTGQEPWSNDDGSPTPESVRADESTYVKFLISDHVAGGIIGKAGATIAAWKQQTGASIKLSTPNSYYPNTTERVLVACGPHGSVETVVRMVIDKMKELAEADELRATGGVTELPPSHVTHVSSMSAKMPVPRSAASIIIGTKGEAIRELAQRTGARINLSDRSDASNERVVTVQGSPGQVIAACVEVFSKVQEDSHVNQLQELLPFGAPLCGNTRRNSWGAAGPCVAPFSSTHHQHVCPEVLQQQCTIAFSVEDNAAGALIGKGGNNIRQIMQVSGAHVHLGPKGEAVRQIQISGSLQCVHEAHVYIVKTLMELEIAAGSPAGHLAAIGPHHGQSHGHGHGGHGHGHGGHSSHSPSSHPVQYPTGTHHSHKHMMHGGSHGHSHGHSHGGHTGSYSQSNHGLSHGNHSPHPHAHANHGGHANTSHGQSSYTMAHGQYQSAPQWSGLAQF